MRSLRHEALSLRTKAHLELYAKIALRSKVARELVGNGTKSHQATESGIAVRVLSSRRDRAGFAAASGFSTEVVRWAVTTASASNQSAPASAPLPSDLVAPERWDLDAPSSLPSEAELTRGLLNRRWVEWVEAGTTIELLLGAEGWLAVRRRDRLWALGAGSAPTLVAQRGFAGWEELLDGLDAAKPGALPKDYERSSLLVLAPDAAAPVVVALVDEFHGPKSLAGAQPGRGWDVIDDPGRRDGLSGGSFDDVGFPTAQRVLATDGVWMGRLGGPGSLNRASFREPPRESATSVVMRAGEFLSVPAEAAIARRCRVMRLSREVWVLDLDFGDAGNLRGAGRRQFKVHPERLLAACASRLGGSIVTAVGAVVPCVAFEGISAS